MTDTFSWDDAGMANDIEVEDICHTVKHQYGGGYNASRAGATKMQKRFKVTWEFMTGAQWLYLVEFWRNQFGSANAFYWEFPNGVYGSPGYGGYGGLEPDDGFDADIDTGFGGGPAFTVKFEENSLVQKYIPGTANRWRVQVSLLEVA